MPSYVVSHFYGGESRERGLTKRIFPTPASRAIVPVASITFQFCVEGGLRLNWTFMSILAV